MTKYELTAFPNQELSLSVEGYNCKFRFHTFRDVIYSNISIDGVEIASGIRCVPNGWLIPQTRVYAEVGNFRFETNRDKYPSYADFDGGYTLLVHYTQEEIEAING